MNGAMQIPSVRRLLKVALITIVVVVAIGCGAFVWYFPHGLTVNFPGFSGAPMAPATLQSRIQLPPGFAINTFATGIDNARMLRFTPAGDLLVSTSRGGKVFLLEHDANNDGVADGQRVLLDNLNRPHGLALHDGWLYVAETDAVLRVRFDPATRQISGAPERIIKSIPGGGNHFTRTLGIGPDGWLYVSIGSDCNVCIEEEPRRAAIVRYHLDGSGEQIYATGLRNAVGFDWQPGTGALYATDNGRDLLGDDFPPCEFNRIVEGGFYGWPYANGDRVPDPDYGKGHDDLIAKSIPPAHGFGAHTAPLGMTFYTGSTFPERYRGAAFVAEHGSWNRSHKSGYQVVALLFDGDGAISEEPFAAGFERNEDVSGRPVDVAVGPDGALYVSDDFTGSIYRIAFGSTVIAASAPTMAVAVAPTGDPLAGIDQPTRDRATSHASALWDASGCDSCHVAGKAGETYRPLANLSRKYTIESLMNYLRTPQPPMPVFPFTDAGRRDLAIYLLIEHP